MFLQIFVHLILKKEKEYDVSWYKGHLSHYQKFRILLHSHHKLPLVYDGNYGEKNAMAQQHLEKVFLDFLLEMQIDFNSKGEDMPNYFWYKMFALGDAIAAVWESGNVPGF